MGMTTPHALQWDILRWNFDVEHLDMILRHNVEYRASLSGLPISVPECSKWDQLGREACQRGWKFGFFGGKCWWNGLKLSWNNPSPLAHHFHQVSLPGSSGAMHYHAKPYHLGQRLLGSVRGWKKCDRVTIRQVNKMHRRQSASRVQSDLPSLATAEDDVDCPLSLLLRTIGTAGISSWGRRQSRSSSAIVWEGTIVCSHAHG